MRIALVTRRYPPECCGVGDYTARLAESWTRQGHEVVVFVAAHGKGEGGRKSEVGSQKSEGRSQNAEEANTASRERAVGPNTNGPPLGYARGKQDDSERVAAPEIRVVRIPLEGWGDVRGAVEAIREARPDEVQLEYSNYGWSRWGFAFWMNRLVHELSRKRSAQDAGLTVTVAMHEFPLTFAQAPRLAGISLLQRLHYALLVLDANEVLTNTQERVRILRGWFPWRRDTIHYRPNSSNIPVARVSEESRAALRAQHAPAGALVVTTFGTYHSNKNFEAVIEAVSELRRERPAALWLLGDPSPAQGAYLETLRGRIRERGLEDAAWWPGRMGPAEISACLSASDIFVLPQPDGHLTRSSAFMSAAEHGLAVIAQRNMENQAEFTHGETVWLVEKSRADFIAEALRTLSGDAALRARLGGNLRALYARRFAWEVAAAPRERHENRNTKSEKREERRQEI